MAVLATAALSAAPAAAQPAEARVAGQNPDAFALQHIPPREPRRHPLRYAPLETDREHFSVGVAPPGARRALLGLHYRLRLGDRRR